MVEDDSPEAVFAVSDDKERWRKIQALSDERLRRLHTSLHASQLINETVWVPLIEEEMTRRGMIGKN